MQLFLITISRRALLLTLIFSLTTASLATQARAVSSPINQNLVQTIQPETVTGLQTFFQELDYDWAALDEGVPPVILEKIPYDINKTPSNKVKKRAFFMSLLPMILLANQEILHERQEIEQILARHRARQGKDGDSSRLQEILHRYGMRGHPLVDHRVRSRLLRRVDIIPPSLVLAQAANESAWGTSRFARVGNNLFGEWTFKPGTGIVPDGRPEGATYEVRKFSSIYESIRSYMNNLNRHSAYRNLREIRESLRELEQPITGLALAEGLIKYSQRGEEYIREIQAMIRHNKLAQANTARLRFDEAEELSHLGTPGAGLLSSRNRIIGRKLPTRHNP